jgi:hypothetical protein
LLLIPFPPLPAVMQQELQEPCQMAGMAEISQKHPSEEEIAQLGAR